MKEAIRILKINRISGIDDILPEYFKICSFMEERFEYILELRLLYWQYKNIPNDWKLSRKRAIFKKGDPAD